MVITAYETPVITPPEALFDLYRLNVFIAREPSVQLRANQLESPVQVVGRLLVRVLDLTQYLGTGSQIEY